LYAYPIWIDLSWAFSPGKAFEPASNSAAVGVSAFHRLVITQLWDHTTQISATSNENSKLHL
jgi:hypothetical protein